MRRSPLVLIVLLFLLVACTPTPPERPAAATSVPAATATATPDPVAVTAEGDLEHLIPSSTLVFRFSEPMEPTSSRDAVEIVPAIPGRAVWGDGNTRLTFIPTRPLQPEQRYQITLDPGLRALSGGALERAPTWNARTNVAPTVRHSPRVLPEEGGRRPTFLLRFNRRMDKERVQAALTVEPSVALDLTWQGNTLAVTPKAALAPSTRYKLSLAPSATDAEGFPLSKPYTVQYALPDVLESVEVPAPQPTAISPLIVRFNYAIDQESAREAIRFSPEVEGEWNWDEEQRVLLLRPQEPLPSDQEYTMRFVGSLQERNGDALPLPETHSFNTPPPILDRTPTNQETPHPAQPIRLVFDRPMDQARTEAALTVEPEVAGSFSWQENTLLLVPEAGHLAPHTNYRVTLGTDARGARGETVLRSPYTWAFRTGAMPRIADFGMGPNAQVLDAAGRRSVWYQFFHRSPSLNVTFSLHRLTPEQFLERYASGFRGVMEGGSEPISTEDTTLVGEWSAEREGSTEGVSVEEWRIPDEVPPGLYVLNLTAGEINDQLILVITNHLVTLKQADREIVAWVTDMQGESLADVEVGLYGRDGSLVREGRTDEAGIFRTEAERDPAPLILIARVGDDISAAGLSNEWRSDSSGWGAWWLPTPTLSEYAVHIHTDRPLYRPGQQVAFKALVRADDDATISLPPAETPVTVRIRDARANVVQTFELATNGFGSVHGTFDVAEGAMLGTYYVEVLMGEEETHRQPFKVQDYRKPDYTVAVATDAPRYIVGEVVEVTVDSRYLFGEPVPNATLTLRQYRLGDNWERTSNPAAPEYIWLSDYGTEPLTAQSDTAGRATFTLPAVEDPSFAKEVWDSATRLTTWGIEVTADDGSHQTVSSFAVVEVYGSAERLFLDHGGYFKQPGEAFDLEAEVLTLDDRPVADRALTVELRRWSSASYDYTEVIQSAEMTSDEAGVARLSLTPEEAGYYQLRVRGTDRLGKPLVATSWLYISSAREWWDDGSGTPFKLVAEQESYAPGDTARLLVQSTFSGPALLSVERGTTRRTLQVELTAPLTRLELPIQADDAPNIFVALSAWEPQVPPEDGSRYTTVADSALRVASTAIKVPVTDKRLTVTLTPDQSVYSPREEATFTIRVTDEAGQPGAAELSLALVDEAIYSLSEELSGPLFQTFYGERPHQVRTYDSMALERYFGGGGGGGGEGIPPGNPRRDFADTATWIPVLETDENGEATLTLTLPDNLTTWRLTARAATAEETQVGEATTTVLTRQDIIVRPLLPRSLTAGDQVALSAIVLNAGETAQEVEISLVVSGSLTVTDALTQSITLEAGAQQVVGWAAHAGQAGSVALDVRAVAAETSDAVRLTLPVVPLAIPTVTSDVGEFTGQLDSTLILPEDALAQSSVRIEVGRSLAVGLLNGLEYLTGFPYGCVEQTMSRALPNAVVGRAFEQLGVANATVEADLPAHINAGVQRLYGFQHEDGGWGWWYDDQSHAYQTAWVVFGLAVTAEAGHEVDPAVIERGAAWLEQNLGGMDRVTRAYALYSLAIAGYGDLEATRDEAKRAETLDPFSQAALALALDSLGQRDEAEAILALLAEGATVEEGQVYWERGGEDGYYDQKVMASTTRSTALALSAFSRLDPDHALVPGIVQWLMAQRRPQGWGTTNETSYAILGLTDHLLATEALTGSDTSYTVELNGKAVASGTLGRATPATTIELPGSALARGENQLRIRQGGEGRLYYQIVQRTIQPQPTIKAEGRIGVERAYLDPQTNQPLTEIAPGQLVRVELTVRMPKDGAYILIEDVLPGGLEALNESLNTTSHESSLYQLPTFFWEEYGYNQKEIRGNRVTFFVTEVREGRYTYRYMARATHAGSFVALPTEVYAMYDLATWGRSASAVVAISSQ